MDERVKRESDFHNRSFKENLREGVEGFYHLAASSRAFYKGFLKENAKDRAILEYGCGQGSYAFFLAEQGAKVTGIDISEVGIEQARSRAKEKSLPNPVDFHVMNAEQLTFPAQSFDLICGTGILHHLDLSLALPEVARTLKPKGSAIFLEPLGHNPLINAYRKLTPTIRTNDEHPLRAEDLLAMKRWFSHVESRFFHLHSLAAFPFRKSRLFRPLVDLLDAFDRLMFEALPRTKGLAWMVCLILSSPRH